MGGMSEIYRAKDLEGGQRVAVKLLRGPQGAGEARFQREARLLEELGHPRIVLRGARRAALRCALPGDGVARPDRARVRSSAADPSQLDLEAERADACANGEPERETGRHPLVGSSGDNPVYSTSPPEGTSVPITCPRGRAGVHTAPGTMT